MSWKDFLYFQKKSRVAVIILLTLIMLILILNTIISSGNRSKIVLQQNDLIIKEFAEFREGLKIRETNTNHKGQSDFIINSENESFTTRETSTSREARANRGTNVPKESITNSKTTRINNAKTNRNTQSIQSQNKIIKLSPGETISLNSTDTTEWKMIPGIGSAYSLRIVKYRALLGGYVDKEQLLEVYGIDNEMYSRISPYIKADSNYRKLEINDLEFKELLRHPYLSYEQVQAIFNLKNKKGDISSINELAMLEEFSTEDIKRLESYIEF